VSTPHLAMKFLLALGDIVIVYVDQKVAREFYVASLKVEPTNQLCYRESPRVQSKEHNKGHSPRSKGLFRDRSHEIKSPRKEHMVVLVNLEPWLNEARIEPGEDLRSLPLRDEEHASHIGTYLKSTDDKLVSQTLIDNVDLFAWTVSDMLGVSPDVITHRVLITSISTKLV